MKEKKEKKEKKSKPKKKKVVYLEDDGRTLYSMEGLDGYPRKKRDDEVRLSRKERRAAILAAFETFFPVLLMVLLAFTLAALLIFVWLK